jgi:hypothetical protein
MTRHFRWLLAVVLAGGGGMLPAARGQQIVPVVGVPCEPGYMIVEEICYREVVHKVCKVVPEMKKVTRRVYSCKEEDYCLPKCACPFFALGKKCDAACCPQCGKPQSRTVLLKKEVIEEIPSFKCVVEEVRQVVPFKVYRKVPCIPVATPMPAPQ